MFIGFWKIVHAGISWSWISQKAWTNGPSLLYFKRGPSLGLKDSLRPFQFSLWSARESYCFAKTWWLSLAHLPSQIPGLRNRYLTFNNWIVVDVCLSVGILRHLWLLLIALFTLRVRAFALLDPPAVDMSRYVSKLVDLCQPHIVENLDMSNDLV